MIARIGTLCLILGLSGLQLGATTAPVTKPAMDRPVNARLKAIMERHWSGHSDNVLPRSVAVQKVVLPKAVISVGTKPTNVAKQPAAVNVLKATIYPNMCATTDLGGHVSSPGPRGNWHTKPTDAYCALPHFDYRGMEVLVRSRSTGRIVALPVYDTGPWSRFDSFLKEKRRPWVEDGKSDTYRHTPARSPGIDLTPEAWRLLGHNPGGNGKRAGNYSGEVDLIVIETTVPRRNMKSTD